MSWEAVEAALDGILERRWYTNHGPLAQRLEQVVVEALGGGHAIVATNPAIALIMLAEALGLAGTVCVSALAPVRCVQALGWAGLQPVFCEPERAAAGPVLWSRGASWAGLGGAAFSDGVILPGVPVALRLPGWGDDAGAACVLTDDGVLAARLRNIRSSYGAGPAVPVRRTANGRLSEAQAAMTLLAWPPAPAMPLEAVQVALPGRLVLDLDGCLALVVEDAGERQRTLQGIAGAEAITPCSPPGLCPAAEAMAERLVLLPAWPDLDALRRLG